MLTPTTLLRDTALVGALMPGAAALWAPWAVDAVAAGVALGLASMVGMVGVVRTLGSPMFGAWLFLHHVALCIGVAALAQAVPVLPLLVGVLCFLPAVSAHAFAGLLVAPPAPPSLEEAG